MILNFVQAGIQKLSRSNVFILVLSRKAIPIEKQTRFNGFMPSYYIIVKIF